MPIIRRNKDKDGIELLFPAKPVERVRKWLGSRGFKYTKYRKIWYNKFSEEKWNEVNAYFESPESQSINKLVENKTGEYKGVTAEEFIMLDITRNLKAAYRKQYYKKAGITGNTEAIKQSLIEKGFLQKNSAITATGKAIVKEIAGNQQAYISGYDELIKQYWPVSPEASLKPVPTLLEVSKKHGMTFLDLRKPLEIGTHIEFEHTNNQATAEGIALQHLYENPRYYSEVKPENWGEKELKEEAEIKKIESDEAYQESSQEILDEAMADAIKTNAIYKEFIRFSDDVNPEKRIKIYLVDGNAVRNTEAAKRHPIKFTMGGHGYVYDYIPKDEAWIDENLRDKPDDMEATIVHEITEIRFMRDKGLAYDEAHELSDKEEAEFRNKRSMETKEEPISDISGRQSQILDVFLPKIKIIKPFISKGQLDYLTRLYRSEEKQAAIEIAERLSLIITVMPGQYETEDIKTPDKIVHLHYSRDDSDWYITEKDKGQSREEEEKAGLEYGKQYQAYGYAILNGDLQNAEWGYVSIEELINSNAEFDFHWEPKKFSEIKEAQEPEEISDTGFSEFLDELSELDLWKAFIQPSGETREYRKFLLNPDTERAITDLGIKERMTDKIIAGKSFIEAIISIKMGQPELKAEIEAAYQENTAIKNINKPVIVIPEAAAGENISLNISDYKNAFEINKGIEALLDKKWTEPLTSWTGEEMQFISNYSGYGGLDEFGQITVGSLFEYFTPEKVIEKMWGLAYKYGYKEGPFIEPSAGIGLFLKREYVKSSVIKSAYEINKYSARICKLLYPEANVNDGAEVKYFEQLFIKNNYTVRGNIKPLHDLIIGNPPYGEAAGLYMGMGEKAYTHAKNYIDYFIFRGLDLLVKDGLLIYIIGAEVAAGGKPWLDQGPSKCKELIAAKGKLIDAYRLPEGLFARTNVVSDIIVFRKR